MKGFSLIELLVAITVVAIISSVGFISFTSSQAKARDAKRKQDLRSLSVALNLYYAVNKKYPAVAGDGYYISTTNPSSWLPQLLGTNKFISSLPLDPLNTGDPKLNDTTSFGYSYWSNPEGTCGSANTYFLLETKLENGDDPESNKNKSYKRCDGTDLTPGGIFAMASE